MSRPVKTETLGLFCSRCYRGEGVIEEGETTPPAVFVHKGQSLCRPCMDMVLEEE